MDSLETFETFAESWREPFVGLRHVAEDSVAACIGNVEGIEEGGPWRLILICDIAVPGDGVGSTAQQVEEGCIFSTAVDKMDFGESLWGSAECRQYDFRMSLAVLTWWDGYAVCRNTARIPRPFQSEEKQSLGL